MVERYRDRYATTVATLSQDGLELIQDVDALTRFMRQYGDKIAAHTLETYMPLYDLKPTEVELAVLEALGKACKALTWQVEAGKADGSTRILARLWCTSMREELFTANLIGLS